MKVLNRLFIVTILLNFLFQGSGFSENEIIIECREGGKNYKWYKEEKGTWNDSMAKSFYGDLTPNIGSRFAIGTSAEEAEARFIPEITEAGNYEVFVIWPKQANIDLAIYKVHSADGDTEIKKMQDGWGVKVPSNSNTWYSLGVFRFEKGNNNYVAVIKPAGELDAPDTRNSIRTYADAVKFVKTDAPVGAKIEDTTKPDKNVSPTPAVQAQKAPTQPTPEPPNPQESSAKIQWINQIQKAKEMASVEKKNILLYFFSSNSNECKKYEQETFKDSMVISFINSKFIPVLIDFTKNYEFSLNLGAYRTPTIILYDSNGNSVKKIEGFRNPSEFLKDINIF